MSDQICIQSHNVPAEKSCCSVVLILSVQANNRGTFIELMEKGNKRVLITHAHTFTHRQHRKQCCAVLMVRTTEPFSAVGSPFEQQNLAAVQILSFHASFLSLTRPFPLCVSLPTLTPACLPVRAKASGCY